MRRALALLGLLVGVATACGSVGSSDSARSASKLSAQLSQLG